MLILMFFLTPSLASQEAEGVFYFYFLNLFDKMRKFFLAHFGKIKKFFSIPDKHLQIQPK